MKRNKILFFLFAIIFFVLFLGIFGTFNYIKTFKDYSTLNNINLYLENSTMNNSILFCESQEKFKQICFYIAALKYKNENLCKNIKYESIETEIISKISCIKRSRILKNLDNSTFSFSEDNISINKLFSKVLFGIKNNYSKDLVIYTKLNNYTNRFFLENNKTNIFEIDISYNLSEKYDFYLEMYYFDRITNEKIILEEINKSLNILKI